VYFIEGASPVNTVSDITSARYYRWTSGVVAANTPTSIAIDVDVLTNGYYRVFVANSQGVLSAPALHKVTISISRASNVVALSCAAGGTCAVGDTGPGGGVVFYVQASGGIFACGATLESTCKYLEAARTDDLLDDEWCSDISTALGTTETVIGTGMANTTTADTTCTAQVIQNAADYTNNGKSDWYLPSKDELNSLYLEREIVGGFSNGYYWSSSEVTNNSVWTQRFETGGLQTINTKDDLYAVRLVRAFGGTLACADGGICAVGDTGPGGGVVFYVQAAGGTFACGATLTSTCKYLEAAPANWLTGTTGDPIRSWATDTDPGVGTGNQVTAVTGARGTAIGSGYKNSLAVVAQTGNVAATSAAVEARAYQGNSKIDWHLPSKDELNQMCKWQGGLDWISDATVCAGGTLNSGLAASGFSSDNYYWSSSEVDDVFAWNQYFGSGYQGNRYKDSTYYVRPVRAF
jgi:hypothetical protein